MLNKKLIKKGMSILLGGVMLTTLSPYAFAALPGSNDECYDALDNHRVFVYGSLTFEIIDKKNKTAKITGADPKIKSVKLSTIVGYDGVRYMVTEIGISAFANCDDLVSVQLPNVTSCEDYSFYSCKNLQSVELPKLRMVETGVFANCRELKRIDLPEVTKIDLWAFADSNVLEYVKVLKCTSFHRDAFVGCAKDLIVETATGRNKIFMSADDFIDLFDRSVYYVWS